MIKRYKLNNSELGNLADLVKNDKEMAKVYNALCDMEVELQNNVVYDDKLDALKDLIKTEKNIYKKLDLNPDKASALIGHLINMNNLKYSSNDQSNIEAVISQQKESLVIRRIITELTQAVLKDGDVLVQMDQAVDSKKNLDQQVKVREMVTNELAKAFLVLLQNNINDPKLAFLKAKLIKIKYNVSFTNKCIEDIFIENRFDIQKMIFVNLSLMFKALNFDEKLSFQMADGMGYLQSYNQINRMLKITDEQIADPEGKEMLTAILRKNYLTATLSLIDVRTRGEVKEKFKHVLQMSSKEDNIFGNADAVTKINEVFNSLSNTLEDANDKIK